MALFMGVHKLPADLTAEGMEQVWRGYCKKCVTAGLKPVQVIFSIERGFANCYTEANSIEDVQKVHEGAEVALDDAIEVTQLTPQ